jgi:hypothetical protein
MELVCWNHEPFGHASVDMNAEHFELFTAVGLSVDARATGTTIQIGLDATAVTTSDIGYVSANLEHFNPKLVSENSRVLNEGHLAQVATQIGAANTDGMNRD